MLKLRKLWRYTVILLGSCFILCLVQGIYILSRNDSEKSIKSEIERNNWLDSEISRDKDKFGIGGSQLLQKLKRSVGHANMLDEDLKNPKHDLDDKKQIDTAQFPKENTTYNVHNYNVHIFYYMWYGNPQVDQKYLHWNHKRLPHWSKIEAKKWPMDVHTPPDDIGSNFYPELGPYSSQDPQTIHEHMQQIVQSGAGVVSVSWYPPDQADDNGEPWDRHMLKVMDAADALKLKVCFHIEPLKDRSPATIKKWIMYIIDQYGKHPAFYRYFHKGKELPVYYIYDSYQVNQWSQLFQPGGSHSVRNTPYDGVFIGLIVESRHREDILNAGFDGYYTYFASTGFTYGSTSTNWNKMSREAKKTGLLFIPSVGPGYVDDRIRPWNKRNTKRRDDGKYYQHMFKLAVESNPSFITITSFNEWHEGTQIEKAIVKRIPGYKYEDYSPHSSDYYLNLTRTWVEKFVKFRKTGVVK